MSLTDLKQSDQNQKKIPFGFPATSSQSNQKTPKKFK